MNAPIPPHPTPAPAGAPGTIDALLERAHAHLASGAEAAAAASFEAVLRLQADNVSALLGLARIHLAREAHSRARTLIMRALRGQLTSPRLALDLLAALNAISESGTMIEVARQLPAPVWDSAKSLAEIAHQLTLIGAHELAREFAAAALQRDPGHPPSLYVQATLDVFFGDIDSAAAHAERCLAILPGDPGSHWLLSRLRQPDAGRRIDRIGRELERAPDREAEAYLAYALHDELHAQKDFDRAWAALERGCRAKRSTLDYSGQRAAQLFNALREWTPEEAAATDGHVEPGHVPVFVIGLHRSGTTLAERILGGHSAVATGGETYDVRAQLRRASGIHFASELDPRVVQARRALDYRSIGEGYVRGMAWRARGASVLTEKLPSNYFNLGFIARALPQARFIHLRRDPVEVGLSSLRTLFSGACPYSYDQSEFVAHYQGYAGLMAHWRTLFPDRILDVDYEALVHQPEATAASMASFCGLAFEPQMVDVSRRGDSVSTASSVMVRDGIRTDRGKVWQAYATQLQPMVDALHG